ncbi:diacylglycerol/lipid kinase family protein [Ramlibacter tataouinensis]|uniref:DAGKc domain-containing protein n=1 Tax=Ramlibacter tataouinensis (strain ATCC BAA-407 / DSM 14655 / LMG 21543 / TTB310) TaxID=365046 RepID=F5XVQ8_RAMTT|nr:diacylglycerol kinase family protein [Ramlibacter tataouinensis]AEG92821.1 conserved hypothetical protein [Ramlibacter tataouinensis TTB310]
MLSTLPADLPDAPDAPLPSTAVGTFYILINPASGANDAQQKREALARVMQEAGCRWEFVPLDSPKALEAVSRAAAERAAREGGVLVAVGGDGTLATVAQAAWQQGCCFGVVPQGTFNYFGRTHGVPQEAEAAARALARAQPQPVQVAHVNGRLFLVNASLGLYPQLLQDREAYKSQLGRHRWVALLSGLVTLFEWRRQLVLEIDLEGQRTVLTTPTLFVGNNKLQFDRLGIEPAVADRVGEGCLAAIVLRPIGTWAMLGLLLRGALGRLGEAEQVRSYAFRTLDVRVRGMRRVKVAADGEVGIMTPPLRFEVASRPLMLMMPRPEDRVPVE